VPAPFLAVFKARLDGALSTLGWWKMSLLVAGGLEPDPFQPLPCYDSMILKVNRILNTSGKNPMLLR